MNAFDIGKRERSNKILFSVSIFMSCGFFIGLIHSYFTQNNLTGPIAIGFSFAMLFHWAIYFLHLFLHNGKKYCDHMTAGFLFLLFFFVAVYNPLHYKEMWIYLLYYPIVVGLLGNSFVLKIWGLFYLLAYNTFLILDPTITLNSDSETVMIVLSRFLFGIGSLKASQIILNSIQDILNKSKVTEELESKELIFRILNNLVPIVEVKSQTSRQEIVQTTELMKNLVYHFPEEKIQAWEIEMLALVHYVSRIQWPDYLFEKKEKLTEFEYKVVQDHCSLGSDLLGDIPAFERIKAAFLYHHERSDGTGYPNAIDCSKIPILSEILGIVEIYSAMTNQRPYRSALTNREAIAEIKSMRGTLFSPKVVDSLASIIHVNEENDQIEMRKVREVG